MFNRNSSKYDQVENDARRLADSISELMKDNSDNEGQDEQEGKGRMAQEKMRQMADMSKKRLRDASHYTREKGQEVDRYAHENVWTTVGIAAGVGALLGAMLMKNKRR